MGAAGAGAGGDCAGRATAVCAEACATPNARPNTKDKATITLSFNSFLRSDGYCAQQTRPHEIRLRIDGRLPHGAFTRDHHFEAAAQRDADACDHGISCGLIRLEIHARGDAAPKTIRQELPFDGARELERPEQPLTDSKASARQ